MFCALERESIPRAIGQDPEDRGHGRMGRQDRGALGVSSAVNLALVEEPPRRELGDPRQKHPIAMPAAFAELQRDPAPEQGLCIEHVQCAGNRVGDWWSSTSRVAESCTSL